MTTKIEEEDVLSLGCGTEIAYQAVIDQVMPELIGDNGKTGDARISLWRFGDTRVIDTNGGARWEDGTDGDDWADMMSGIIAE